ncbi:hypothetical protein KUCAC02_001119, partial [Chaenocephalus aceratus]
TTFDDEVTDRETQTHNNRKWDSIRPTDVLHALDCKMMTCKQLRALTSPLLLRCLHYPNDDNVGVVSALGRGGDRMYESKKRREQAAMKSIPGTTMASQMKGLWRPGPPVNPSFIDN